MLDCNNERGSSPRPLAQTTEWPRNPGSGRSDELSPNVGSAIGNPGMGGTLNGAGGSPGPGAQVRVASSALSYPAVLPLVPVQNHSGAGVLSRSSQRSGVRKIRRGCWWRFDGKFVFPLYAYPLALFRTHARMPVILMVVSWSFLNPPVLNWISPKLIPWDIGPTRSWAQRAASCTQRRKRVDFTWLARKLHSSVLSPWPRLNKPSCLPALYLPPCCRRRSNLCWSQTRRSDATTLLAKHTPYISEKAHRLQ